LKELADTFDAMLTRLETAFEGQRRFVANASHELRTPLAIARTEIDVTLGDPDASPAELRAMGEKVREATARSERLIDRLLALARSSSIGDARESDDLANAAVLALDQNQLEAAARGLRIDTNLEPATTNGDRTLLELLVENLVENAIRHNVQDGRIAITTKTTAGKAQLTVNNGGPIIPPEEIETLFEPFRRLGHERTGSDRGVGLGLSIVRAIATAHSGIVRARALPEGGLEVVVELPARRPTSEATVNLG
jgi:signal transduction histidine kinase